MKQVGNVGWSRVQDCGMGLESPAAGSEWPCFLPKAPLCSRISSGYMHCCISITFWMKLLRPVYFSSLLLPDFPHFFQKIVLRFGDEILGKRGSCVGSGADEIG
ncbi:hypothetical protein KC19_11G124400 [Ceratodon purpureus]|uniref:Uncharacterized protein n=1 Tax=Ceratodon purpureus TaxID=3225 RepID=A0A8T0GGC8_CERPU|nr:hypothetical protein KC19_11G124400 [Ceratodon purpureus]